MTSFCHLTQCFQGLSKCWQILHSISLFSGNYPTVDIKYFIHSWLDRCSCSFYFAQSWILVLWTYAAFNAYICDKVFFFLCWIYTNDNMLTALATGLNLCLGTLMMLEVMRAWCWVCQRKHCCSSRIGVWWSPLLSVLFVIRPFVSIHCIFSSPPIRVFNQMPYMFQSMLMKCNLL